MSNKNVVPATETTPPVAVLIDMLYYQVNLRVAERLQAAGFVEIRASHGKVFENLGEGCRVSELAEKAQVTKQSMAELVAYLEELNYLERVPDATDRRAKIVQLTPRGKKAVRTAQKILAEIHAEWSAMLGSKTFADLQRTLSDMVRNLMSASP